MKDIIAIGRADRTYPKWSDHFLSFCEHTSDATTRYLERQLATNGNVPIAESLGYLPIIIQGWEVLHTFIKPVLDADNLKVPYPLVHFLTEHVGKLEKVKEAKFVIEISPELNYFQHQHTDLNRAVFFLQAIIGGPTIESMLGFLALPCSQSQGLFMNCLLYHEVGHFIAEENGLLSPSDRAELRVELENAFQQQLDEDVFQQYLYWAVTTIEKLMEEIFADIVAVKLIGIAYTLSYMELLLLVTDLSEDQMKNFFIDHPADALRFREQLKAIEKDGWGKNSKKIPHWKRLKSIVSIKANKYSVPSDYESDPEMKKVWTILIKHLCKPKRITKIHKKADSLLTDRELPYELYMKYAERIEDCLCHGIVPSIEREGHIPHPLAVINGAVIFWLSRMHKLYRTVPKRDEKNINDRAFMEKRVEMWCLKAIEDWLKGEKKK